MIKYLRISYKRIEHLLTTILRLGLLGVVDFGFDYHFNAYGTMAMVLYNGNTDPRGRNKGDQSAEQFALFQNQHHGGLLMDPYKFGFISWC